MKKLYYIILFAFFLLFDQTSKSLSLRSLLTEELKESNRIFLNGTGYASDTEFLASAPCYHVLSISRTAQSFTLRIDKTIDTNTLANDVAAKPDIIFLKTSSDVGLHYYVKSHQETSTAVSFHVYLKVSGTIMMQYGQGEGLLNDPGKAFYDNGGNPLFRLACGDTLVREYEEGALLIISLRMHFNNAYEKTDITKQIGGEFLGLLKASQSVRSAAREMNVVGNIEITAFQLGGDAIQLSRLLVTEQTICKFNEMNSTFNSPCDDAIQSLLDYTANDFPNQFVVNSSSLWFPLVPTGRFKLGYSVDELGLVLSPSYLTIEVQSARTVLVKDYDKYEMIRDNLIPILMDYPYNLTDNYKSNINKYYQIAINNLYLLTEGPNSTFYSRPAFDCWLFPQHCVEIKNNLTAAMESITASDIETLVGPIKNNMEIDIFPLQTFFFDGENWRITPGDINTGIIIADFTIVEFTTELVRMEIIYNSLLANGTVLDCSWVPTLNNAGTNVYQGNFFSNCSDSSAAPGPIANLYIQPNDYYFTISDN